MPGEGKHFFFFLLVVIGNKCILNNTTVPSTGPVYVNKVFQTRNLMCFEQPSLVTCVQFDADCQGFVVPKR